MPLEVLISDSEVGTRANVSVEPGFRTPFPDVFEDLAVIVSCYHNDMGGVIEVVKFSPLQSDESLTESLSPGYLEYRESIFYGGTLLISKLRDRDVEMLMRHVGSMAFSCDIN